MGDVTEVLQQDPGPMNNGVFGPYSACPRGSFAVGFRTRFSAYHGNIHVLGNRNMAIAGVHLLCEDREDLAWKPFYVASNEVRATGPDFSNFELRWNTLKNI